MAGGCRPPSSQLPAVAAASARRWVLLAPAAVRMRRSLAASLRIKPTVLASTARARMMPAAVAPVLMAEKSGCPVEVSMRVSAASASRRAALS